MNTIRFATKEDFIAALEGRRPFWRDYDKRQAAQHHADEKQWLSTARATLREALKMDYKTLRETASDYYGRLTLGEAPKCPVLEEPKIDRVLAALRLTCGKSFSVDSNGAWETAHHLLTADPSAPKTVC